MCTVVEESSLGCSFVPDTLAIQGDYLNQAVKASVFSYSFFEEMAEFFRDRFYLPLNLQSQDPFLIDSGAYAAQFVEMLKGTNPHLYSNNLKSWFWTSAKAFEICRS